MSLVTILENKEFIVNTVLNKDLNIDAVIANNLSKQYEMMWKNLNKNTLKNFHQTMLHGDELISAYYKHAFSHNYIALMDEIYEVLDAKIKHDNYIAGETTDKETFNKRGALIDKEMFNKRRALILEELIDVYHFILEFSAISTEIGLVSLYSKQSELFTYDKLTDLLTNNVSFYEDVHKLCELRGNHIQAELELKLYDFDYLSTDVDDYMHELSRLARNFIRECNFKDWKVYDKEFYTTFKQTELNLLSRLLYYPFIKAFGSYIYEAYDIFELKDCYKNTEDINKNIFRLINAIYLSKRKENIRRQNNDPRYTGKLDGVIIGQEVK